MSNVIAAIGRGQLRVLAERVRRRREVCEAYQRALKEVPGLSWMPEASYGESTRWLTVVQIDPAEFGATPEEARQALEARDIESRPVWKPLHLQPLFRSCRVVGGAVSEGLFRGGLCLPSGSQMTEGDIFRVVEALRSCRDARLHRVRTRRLAS